MDNSSSSSSGLEEASMEDSEQEHEYDYDIDEADDDPHDHDGYEDLPEEEDDDDDDDDDIVDHHHHLPHLDMSGSLSGVVSDLRLNRADPFVHALPLRSRNSVDGVHLETVVPVEASFLFSHSRDDFLRSVVFDGMDGYSGPEHSRLLSQLEGMRVEPPDIYTRLRSATIPPLMSSQWNRMNEPPEPFHPHLNTPRPPTSTSSSFALLQSLSRRSQHVISLFERAGTTTSVSNTPRMRAMDAIHRVASIPGVAPAEPRPSSADTPSTSSRPPHMSSAQASSSTAPPQQSPRPTDAEDPLSDPLFSSHVPSSVPRTRNAEPLNHLYHHDLMRSIAMPPEAEQPLLSLSRSRTQYERHGPRDRDGDGERASTTITRRWSYDPPLTGGDNFPPLFDSESGYRHSRPGFRGQAGHPFGISEVSKPVTKVASKITNKLANLLEELGEVDGKLTKSLKDIEKRQKEAEEKRKEAENPKDESNEEGEQADVDTGREDAEEAEEPVQRAAPEDRPAAAAELMRAVFGDASEDASDPLEVARTSGHATAASEESRIARRASAPLSGVADISPAAQTPAMEMEIATEPAAEAVPDAIDGGQGEAAMNDGEVPATEAGQPATAMDTAEEAEQRPDSSITPVTDGTAGTTAEGQDSGLVFSAVATERAAAVGISLHAPANENPEVVAAATQSTGIDPAFLTALPEDMRAEILTQYYEQIRTTTPAQGEASASAPATTVNQDFLIALPPALRAEVLELEAEFMARQETVNNASGGNANNASGSEGGAAVAAEEMDNATFLATLAPELREEILLTSGEAFIQSLPPNVAAEARVLREREMSSRLPWNVGRNTLNVFNSDGRLVPAAVRGTATHGRRGRHEVRDPPVFRWKKTDAGWLREPPKQSSEPAVVIRSNGLSALVELLWTRTELYGKRFLYHVFSHVCKTTESRYVVLEELLKLVTGNRAPVLEKKPTASGATDADRARFYGTAVRRGLEFLSMLSRNDTIVAETLLGLPRNEGELKSCGEACAENGSRSESSLSTLLTLLNNSLFERSNAHLEQLLVLILAITQAIPPRKANSTDSTRNRRVPLRSRAFLERPGLDLNDPRYGLFYAHGNHDENALVELRDDDGDDAIPLDEMFESAIRSAVQSRAEPASRPANEAGSNSQQDANKDQVVPVKFRIPALREEDLVSITKVLVRTGCSDRTYDRASRTLGMLGELPWNREIFSRALVSIAMRAGEDIVSEFEKCSAEVQHRTDECAPKTSPVENAFLLTSASNELTLLRVVKSLSSLLKHSTIQAKEALKGDAEAVGDSVVDDGESVRLGLVNRLKDVWVVLGKLLTVASEEVMQQDRKETKGVASSSRDVTARMLNPGRIKASSRGLSPSLGRLSALIEAFLVTHSAEDDSEVSEDGSIRAPPSTPPPACGDLAPSSVRSGLAENGLELDTPSKIVDKALSQFVEKHRGPINALLRSNPALLETSFKGALQHPHAIDFDNKKAYFRNVIRRRSSEAHAGTIRIAVRRERVFDDSYQKLRNKSPDEMKGRLHVQFNGEEGVDAGGVTREWYTILARQIFDPNYVLFTRSGSKAATYQPDKRSYINSEHLENFRFVGRIIGKAIYDGQLLDAYFTRSFYKHILGLKPTYHDIEAQDPEYYRSLKWMLENPINGILDYTMSAEYDEFGKQTVVDLLPNGRNIAVTDENKAEYVRLVTEVRMTKTIEKQIEGFKEGFYELIPYDDCKIFNELELELLMSGLPDIDMSDLKANVEYTGYTASSPQVNWFWRCVGKMDQEDLARLVMFVTGTSKVPLEGFGHLQGMNGTQKFQIHRVGGNDQRLPSAHTCFNQLDLPEYGSAEVLSERLLRAVRECSVGFGFA